MRYKRNAHFRTTLAQSLLKSSKLRNVFTLSLVAPKTLTRVLPNNLCPFHQPSISCHAALYTVEELYTHGRQRVPHKVRAKTRHEQSCLLLSLSLSPLIYANLEIACQMITATSPKMTKYKNKSCDIILHLSFFKCIPASAVSSRVAST